ALEGIAARVESLLGVTIDVYGFDTGTGLPPLIDYRDRPNAFAEGDFPDGLPAPPVAAQEGSADLGQHHDDTTGALDTQPAPVAFVAVDVDLYSSTMATLRLFDANTTGLLPRVPCYFDDIIGFSIGDCNGER